MEFLRFGSSIPGTYWGCCACDIIQNFHHDPDEKSSIQIVSGDGGNPIIGPNNEPLFAGPTYRDIFWQRLRYGTFGKNDMPNHAFFAILTQSQISGGAGKKWLAILKEAGFEFLRTVDNSVYSGPETIRGPGQGCTSSHPNYIFALFRNIGSGAMADPFTPPKAWTDLNPVVYEMWEDVAKMGDLKEVNERIQKVHLELFNKLPKGEFMTEAEVTKAGAPVVLAGLRSTNPQEPKSTREKRNKTATESKPAGKKAAAPFAAATAAA